MTDIKDVQHDKHFYCKKCDFTTYNKYNFNKHLLTDKHNLITNTDKILQENEKVYDCICGKSYKHRQSLLTHKKKSEYNKIDDLIEIKKEQKGSIEYKIDYEKIIDDLINVLKLQNKLVQEKHRIIQEQNEIIQEQNKTIYNLISKMGNN